MNNILKFLKTIKIFTGFWCSDKTTRENIKNVVKSSEKH